jgi:uncharacterized protein (TIGR03643 family)
MDVNRIIEMAWEDRTPFEAIKLQFGLTNGEVIKLMRTHLKPSSFKLWRKRTDGQKTKHALNRVGGMDRFRCSQQRLISNNKIAKRK